MNIAIIGYGSIGQRHEKNCLALGYKVDVLSRHAGRGLTRNKYDLLILCSKTFEHLRDVKRYKDIGNNFLIEKPLSVTSSQAFEIKQTLQGKKVRVGYCLIFNPIIKKVKKILEEKVIGRIYFGQICAGSYLPGWRGKGYQKSYSAKKDEGGGVALDLIHEINYSQYFFDDEINDIYCYQDKVSNLEIDSNDLAFFALRYKARFVSISLNYFQFPPERYIKLVGTKGALFADLIKKRVDVFIKNKKIYSKRFDFDDNQMYIDEVNSMLKFTKEAENQNEILSVDQGIRDLKIVEGKI